MSWGHLTVVGEMWYDDKESLGGKRMKRTIRETGQLVAAAMIVLTGAAWADGQLYRPTPDDGEDTTLVSLPNFCTVMFDANGGVCSEMARNVERDTAVGSLPEATRE